MREEWRMGLIVPMWKRKVQGHHSTTPSTGTVGEVFRLTDQEESRM